MAAGNYQGTYAAEQGVTIVGGAIITGFGDGDYITVKYDEDRYIKKTGCDGEVGRSRTASRAGTIEIVTSATSKANDELSAIFNFAQIGGIDPPVVFSHADLSGRSFAAASKAWIKTTPDYKFGKEIGENVWILDAADLAINFGGNG